MGEYFKAQNKKVDVDAVLVLNVLGFNFEALRAPSERAENKDVLK